MIVRENGLGGWRSYVFLPVHILDQQSEQSIERDPLVDLTGQYGNKCELQSDDVVMAVVRLSDPALPLSHLDSLCVTGRPPQPAGQCCSQIDC